MNNDKNRKPTDNASLPPSGRIRGGTPVRAAQEPAEQNASVRNAAVRNAAGRNDARSVRPQKKTVKKSGSGKASQPDKTVNNAVSGLLKAIIYIVAVLVVGVTLAYIVIVVGNDVFAFVKSDEIVEVTIPEDADIDCIADVLYENGIIKYPAIFRYYAAAKSDNSDFLSGDIEVSASMNYGELLDAFKYKYVRGTSRIAIPEGLTVNEIIDIFLSYGIGTREGFTEAINNYPFDYDFVRALDENPNEGRTYRLEGYLYPDTYEFYNDNTEVQVIYKLLDEFNTKFGDAYRARADELGMTTDQIVTLASLIEKETKYLDEYEYVSSVFYNRLNSSGSFEYLESDATVVYAIQIATGKRIVPTAEDLYFDSPYNTYTHKGLPPGPISNPGFDAISVALYPAATNYYYFVADSSGRTIFSRTLAEHKAAIASINAGN